MADTAEAGSPSEPAPVIMPSASFSEYFPLLQIHRSAHAQIVTARKLCAFKRRQSLPTVTIRADAWKFPNSGKYLKKDALGMITGPVAGTPDSAVSAINRLRDRRESPHRENVSWRLLLLS